MNGTVSSSSCLWIYQNRLGYAVITKDLNYSWLNSKNSCLTPSACALRVMLVAVLGPRLVEVPVANCFLINEAGHGDSHFPLWKLLPEVPGASFAHISLMEQA